MTLHIVETDLQIHLHEFVLIPNSLVRFCTDMEQFHNHFKYEFRKIWNDAPNVDPEEPESLEEFLDEADGLYSHLSAHHGIEVRFSVRFMRCTSILLRTELTFFPDYVY